MLKEGVSIAAPLGLGPPEVEEQMSGFLIGILDLHLRSFGQSLRHPAACGMQCTECSI